MKKLGVILALCLLLVGFVGRDYVQAYVTDSEMGIYDEVQRDPYWDDDIEN